MDSVLVNETVTDATGNITSNGDSTITPSIVTGLATTDAWLDITVNILVWICIFGLSATVDFEQFKKRLRTRGIYVGLCCQFFLLPIIGFITVSIIPIPPTYAVVLLVIVSSPGGSYSNWWAGLFNADLALSVAMTTISSVCSMFMLPINILLWVSLAYVNTQEMDSEVDVAKLVEFETMAMSLGLVLSALVLGLGVGLKFPHLSSYLNKAANFAGTLSLVMVAFLSSSTEEKPWAQDSSVYVACAIPLLVGMAASLAIGSAFKLPKPQRVAVAIETAYQNTNIAVVMALMIPGGRSAMVVPVIYGAYEAIGFALFCFISWKIGWTLAPANHKMWNVLFSSYQNYDQTKNDVTELSSTTRFINKKAGSRPDLKLQILPPKDAGVMVPPAPPPSESGDGAEAGYPYPRAEAGYPGGPQRWERQQQQQQHSDLPPISRPRVAGEAFYYDESTMMEVHSDGEYGGEYGGEIPGRVNRSNRGERWGHSLDTRRLPDPRTRSRGRKTALQPVEKPLKLPRSNTKKDRRRQKKHRRRDSAASDGEYSEGEINFRHGRMRAQSDERDFPHSDRNQGGSTRKRFDFDAPRRDKSAAHTPNSKPKAPGGRKKPHLKRNNTPSSVRRQERAESDSDDDDEYNESPGPRRITRPKRAKSKKRVKHKDRDHHKSSHHHKRDEKNGYYSDDRF